MATFLFMDSKELLLIIFILFCFILFIFSLNKSSICVGIYLSEFEMVVKTILLLFLTLNSVFKFEYKLL